MRADTSAQAGETAARTGFDRLSLLWLAGLAFSALSLYGGLVYLLIQLHAMPFAGNIGRERFNFLTNTRPGYYILNTVPKGSPLDQAGVKSGDEVAFDRPTDALRVIQAGERVGLTIERGGRPAHLTVVAEPVLGAPFPEPPFNVPLFFAINLLFPSILGFLILLRARGNLNATLYGLGLSALGATVTGMIGPVSADLFSKLFIPTTIVQNLAALAIIGFSMIWGRPPDWRLSRIHWIVLYASLLVTFAFDVVRAEYLINPGITESALYHSVPHNIKNLILVCPFIYFTLATWRSSPRSERGRQTLFFIGLGIGAAGNLLIAVPPRVYEALHIDGSVGPVISSFVGLVVAPALGAYAILRHRILDIGFAVNRTLIYGAVSAILLVLFGLIEWSVDHFVPIEGREKNVIVDAVVAVGVFLTFHRVRDAVEHAVKAVFFERWQKAEAALRRFVHEAAFVKSRDALIATFVEAISKYADGADAAIYLAAADGYQRAGGALAGIGATIDIDDPLLVALRADPRVFEVGDTRSKLGATLAAPLINRNEVIGVVLVGAKPVGVVYRPDEIALIGWASRQIGYDLHALKVEALEANDLRKSGEIALLNARIEGLLAGRPAG